MQFSSLALAAFITAGVHGACPASGHPPHQPSGAFSIPNYSYSFPPFPTTLRSVTPTPAVTPATTLVPTTTSSPPSSSAAPTTSSVPSSDSSLTADESSALSTQNDARADVGEAALIWDASLVSDAQVWANHLATLTPGTLTHDDQSSEGENLYWQSGDSDPYSGAAQAWVAEKSSYNGEAITGTGNFDEYGHYTQIIWGSTTHIGMAIADDGAGGVYVVARYSPPGNMIGETPTTSS